MDVQPQSDMAFLYFGAAKAMFSRSILPDISSLCCRHLREQLDGLNHFSLEVRNKIFDTKCATEKLICLQPPSGGVIVLGGGGRRLEVIFMSVENDT